MADLIHKDYVPSVKEANVIPDVKTEIRALVGKGQKESYENIIKAIQAAYPIMTNDDVTKQIKEVSKEADYTPKVEMEVAEL